LFDLSVLKVVKETLDPIKLGVLLACLAKYRFVKKASASWSYSASLSVS